MVARKKKNWKKLIYPIYLLVILVPLIEVALRIGGYRPYISHEFSITSTPKNSLCPHHQLGLALSPGHFTITINDGLTYQATHSTDSLRAIPGAIFDSTKPTLGLFGCSFTYGMGVNDNEVMSAHLTKAMKDHNVINYGIPGYGNIQGYYQLQSLIQKGQAPQIAIFNFADFHLDRNVLTPEYRIHLKLGYDQSKTDSNNVAQHAQFPFVRLDDKQLVFHHKAWNNLYEHWLGRKTFALVNFAQSASDYAESKELDKETTSSLLFEAIHQLCRQHKIRLIVAGITKNEATNVFLARLKKLTIETCDISLPLEEKKYNNQPYDSHPNSLAHQLYAQRIEAYLTKKQE